MHRVLRHKGPRVMNLKGQKREMESREEGLEAVERGYANATHEMLKSKCLGSHHNSFTAIVSYCIRWLLHVLLWQATFVHSGYSRSQNDSFVIFDTSNVGRGVYGKATWNVEASKLRKYSTTSKVGGMFDFLVGSFNQLWNTVRSPSQDGHKHVPSHQWVCLSVNRWIPSSTVHKAPLCLRLGPRTQSEGLAEPVGSKTYALVARQQWIRCLANCWASSRDIFVGHQILQHFMVLLISLSEIPKRIACFRTVMVNHIAQWSLTPRPAPDARNGEHLLDRICWLTGFIWTCSMHLRTSWSFCLDVLFINSHYSSNWWCSWLLVNEAFYKQRYASTTATYSYIQLPLRRLSELAQVQLFCWTLPGSRSNRKRLPPAQLCAAAWCRGDGCRWLIKCNSLRGFYATVPGGSCQSTMLEHVVGNG